MFILELQLNHVFNLQDDENQAKQLGRSSPHLSADRLNMPISLQSTGANDPPFSRKPSRLHISNRLQTRVRNFKYKCTRCLSCIAIALFVCHLPFTNCTFIRFTHFLVPRSIWFLLAKFCRWRRLSFLPCMSMQLRLIMPIWIVVMMLRLRCNQQL